MSKKLSRKKRTHAEKQLLEADTGSVDTALGDYEMPPEEEYGEPVDYEMPPEDGYEAAGDYEMYPEEEYEEPADYEMPPEGEYEESGDYEMYPEDGYEAAGDYEMYPADGYEESVDYEMPPEDGYEELVDYEMLPEDGYEGPVDYEMSPEDGYGEPVDYEVLPEGEFGETGEYEEPGDYEMPPEDGFGELQAEDYEMLPSLPKTGRRRTHKICAALVLCAVLAVVIRLVYLLLPGYCVKCEITVEVGDPCPAVAEFLNWKNADACFVSDINEETVFDQIGDYGVLINVYGRTTASVVHVRDTAAPVVTTRSIRIYSGTEVEPYDFIEKIEDLTATAVRFGQPPDCETAGIHTVILEVGDEGGNITTAEAQLEVIHDDEPPEINGVEEITITAGASVLYKKGVTVTDNCDKNVQLTVDTNSVNTSKPGDYVVTYSASDAAGNAASVSTVLHVMPVTAKTVTEEIINVKADELLAEILDDAMTPYEKAKTIYWWCHEHIAYSNGAPKENWVQGAYQGIVDHKGDCYTYATTAKCLLTRAGITNMDIEKIRVNNSMHYWNLIDIGEGWHHFDTTRRADGATFFYLTDEELMRYSKAHNGTHNYDRELYPAIP